MAIGMDMARLVRDEATAGTREGGSAGLPVGEASVAFERIAKAVRRTVRMVRWLEQPVAARADGGRARARKQIIRAVEDGIDREAAGEAADTLHVEMLERLDSLELDDDVAGRPVAEIVREILADLGVRPGEGMRPRRRGAAELAVMRARAAAATGETVGVAGARFGSGRAEQGEGRGGDISQVSDEELERLHLMLTREADD